MDETRNSAPCGEADDDRATVRRAFLCAVGCGEAEIEAIPGDASFRRYFRLHGAPLCGRSSPLILMDAPPGREALHPFVAIDGLLRRHGLRAPEIIAADPVTGFLLLEDFGDASFTRLLDGRRRCVGPTEETLYAAAVDLLVDLRDLCEWPDERTLPINWPQATLSREDAPDRYPLAIYDGKVLGEEARLFCDWYLPLVTGQDCDPATLEDFHTLWRPILDELESALDDDPVLVLRDYHADNLMWLEGRDGHARIGLLDFQDAVIGHPAYDLVSLLHDARRDVPYELEERMFRRYLKATGSNPHDFGRVYALLGVQRATKVIGIFSRLARRDGKSRYLGMIPHVWRLLEHALSLADEPALQAFYDYSVPTSRRRVVPLIPSPPEELSRS